MIDDVLVPVKLRCYPITYALHGDSVLLDHLLAPCASLGAQDESSFDALDELMMLGPTFRMGRVARVHTKDAAVFPDR